MFGPGARTAVVAVAVGLAVATAAPASAASVGPPITSGLVGPLGLALGPGGERDIYVSQSFASPGLLTRVKGGEAAVVHTEEEGVSVEGLAVDRDGSVLFTASAGGMEPTAGLLKRRARSGAVTTVGDPFAYEQAENPDGRRDYGFHDLPAECAAQLPPHVDGEYEGGVDSHPYAVAVLADGSYAVADAGGNTIVRVTRKGVVSTIAVLPAQPVLVTAENAEATGLPDCTIGRTYRFEAVPTDVEVGPDGQLYVTTLPGGPEDAALGARGSVYRIDPETGRTRRLGTGFLGATGLAVTPEGRVYVAELFGNRVSRLVDGKAVELVDLPAPAALEVHRGSLYATVDSLPAEGSPPDGKVVRIRL